MNLVRVSGPPPKCGSVSQNEPIPNDQGARLVDAGESHDAPFDSLRASTRLLLCAALWPLLASGAEAARNPLTACQKAIDDVGASLLKKAVSFQQKCLQKRDAGKVSPFTGCILNRDSVGTISDVKTRNAILASTVKARAALQKRCAGVDLLADSPDGLEFGETCPSVSGACSAPLFSSDDALTCVVCTHLATAWQAVVLQRPGLRAGESFPIPTPTPGGNACPVALEVEANAGSSKVLDVGWTGLGHNSTVVSDATLTLTLDCNPTSRPCGVCQLGGPIANLNADDGSMNSQRCSGDSSKKCTTGGSECAGLGDCVFFFGAPQPLSAGGVSSCIVNRVNGAVSGTTNTETGVFALTLNLTSRVALGPTDEPCPTCEGDGATNDGTAGGTCNGGARNGQACDVNGVSPIPSFGKTSLDCPPQSFVSALSIPLVGSSGTETKSLDGSSPACTGAIGKKCFCPAAGTQPTQPNACLDSTLEDGDQSLCVPVSGGSNQGQCPATADTVCSPTETFRGCLNNNDCTVSGDTCIAVNRPCYLDNGVVGGSVTAIGMADPPQAGVSDPTFAALYCIPPVAQASINAATGIPGLGRIEVPLRITEILTLP